MKKIISRKYIKKTKLLSNLIKKYRQLQNTNSKKEEITI